MLILLAAVGCGGSADAPGAFNSEYPQVLCSLAFRCCAPAERRGLGASVEECAQGQRQTLDKMASLIAKGQVPFAFDAVAAQTCLNWIRPASCDDLSSLGSSACPGVYRGYAALGQVCFDGTWCAAGLGCAFDGDEEAGRCQVPGGEGAACGLCRPDLWCDDVSKTCQASRADGAACRLDRECRSGDCLSPTPQSPGTCGPPPPVCTGALPDASAADTGID
jgi:hypothetical protein